MMGIQYVNFNKNIKKYYTYDEKNKSMKTNSLNVRNTIPLLPV